jgi:hypothetical protein
MNDTELSDRQRFQIAVADALSRWQVVEINLQKLFVAVIESPDSRWSAAAYNAVLALKAKTDMLNEILKWRLPPKSEEIGWVDLPKEWETLRNKVMDMSRKRNYLVHWTFIATYTPENRETYTYVATPFGDVRKNQAGRQLKEEDLVKMSMNFGILQAEIQFFHQRALPLLAPPAKFPL